jgi:hypothetical protein
MTAGKRELMRLGREALRRLSCLADEEGTSEKSRIDIYKWLAEMAFGKPASRAAAGEDTAKNSAPASVRFEGELDEWAG